MASATSVEAAGTRARQREGLRPAERVEAWPCYSSPAESFYAEATGALRRDLAGAVPRDVLRALHRCQAWRHFAVVGAQLAVLAAGVALAAGGGWVWPLGSALIGLVIFNFTVLLHEVVHQNVFRRRRHWANRVLGLVYAAPCGLVPSQFARWHLDHHAQLGDPAADPKRCHLSPKRNARWLKALYWTPALFPIYFRAARRAAVAYPPALRRVIARERAAMMVGHAALLAGLVVAGGWMLALKVYLIPLFFVFPIAFALNRLAQHYDVDAGDPAKWATLMGPSRVWEAVYLWSAYHLEHHYFPRLPFYNLRALHFQLQPFFAARGMAPRTFGGLLRGWFLANAAPHTDWRRTTP